MLTVNNNPYLRYVLYADAATCLITGLAMSVANNLVGGITELPPELLLIAGLSLIPFAASLIYFGTRKVLAVAALWFVIIVNVLWTIGSILLVIAGWVTPNAFGTFFVLFQAIGVGAFAVIEYILLSNAARWSKEKVSA